MDRKRLQYLRRMGIDVWVSRDAPRGESAKAQEFEPQVRLSEDDAAVSSLNWEQLARRVASCRLCHLCETRTQTVFGVGDPHASLVVVGEAPGAEEDRQGEPFVGRAGRLLNNMLRAIGLSREQVFILNILKCRPPNNRDPSAEEVVACSPYLIRQLELIRPRLLLAVGRIAAQTLLDTQQSLGRLRGRPHAYGPAQIPVIVTYHPAYLLRSPAEKRKAWDDLKVVYDRLHGADQRSSETLP